MNLPDRCFSTLSLSLSTTRLFINISPLRPFPRSYFSASHPLLFTYYIKYVPLLLIHFCYYLLISLRICTYFKIIQTFAWFVAVAEHPKKIELGCVYFRFLWKWIDTHQKTKQSKTHHFYIYISLNCGVCAWICNLFIFHLESSIFHISVSSFVGYRS